MNSFQRPKFTELEGKRFDFLVVGAGITGAGVAQDAASRGYSTLLVDKGDFASGTSSKSTKLIHGGLRYLANMQLGVTMESLSERLLQQKIAPHMVWAIPFVIPLYKGQLWQNLKMRLGLVAYDLLAGFGNKFKHKSISAAELQSLCPGLKSKGLKAGLLYYDCRTDDARHTLEVILSAVQHGALALNYGKMVAALKNSQGKIVGLQLLDCISGQSARVYGRCIINATGVWAQATSEAAGAPFNGELQPSKGIHICVERKLLPLDSALIIPSAHDSRFLFAVPWYDHIVIGTTDTAYKGDLENPQVEPQEVDYILDAVNLMFPQARLSACQIKGRYAGLRPLVKSSSVNKTADLSRRHLLDRSPEGLISVSGGKLTTYRLMARETVDLALAGFCCPAQRKANLSCTEKLVLGGFDLPDQVELLIKQMQDHALKLGLSAQTAAYLPRLYGKRCLSIFEILKERPELAESLVDGQPYIMAQVLYALRFEYAQTLSDLLARRIRLAILDTGAAVAAAQKASRLMASELAWSEGLRQRKLLEFAAEWK